MAKKKTAYTTIGYKTPRQAKTKANGANLGFEEKLWQTTRSHCWSKYKEL